jgi:hypothetical protein
MGSLVKCVGCGERCGSRPIGVYWRWMRADGVWKHYYQRVCAGCYAAKVLPLDVDHPGDMRLTCPGCGIDTEDDYDGVYTTSFPGKGPQVNTESAFCGVCAAVLRLWVVDHARDTDTHEGAPRPPHESRGSEPASGATVLRDMGIQPRVR